MIMFSHSRVVGNLAAGKMKFDAVSQRVTPMQSGNSRLAKRCAY